MSYSKTVFLQHFALLQTEFDSHEHGHSRSLWLLLRIKCVADFQEQAFVFKKWSIGDVSAEKANCKKQRWKIPQQKTVF